MAARRPKKESPPPEKDSPIIVLSPRDTEGGENSRSKLKETPEIVKDPDKTKQSFNATDLLLLVFLVVLENANVMLTRYTRESGKDRPYEINHLMLVTEASKFTLAFLLEAWHLRGGVWRSIKIYNSSWDGLKVAFPAGLYFLQNTLFYVALTNLSTPVFQVTYQSKLIVTAIVSVLLLGRRYTLWQWSSLAVISAGVAIAVLSKNEGGDQNVATTHVGLVAVLGGSLSSALAGVLFEKYIKRDASLGAEKAPPSLWMRNMQLAVFSVLCAFSKEIFEEGNSKLFLYGFTEMVWTLIMLRASTGLLVAVIVRRMDNVVKGLTSSISVVFGIWVSRYIFDTRLSRSFWLGAAMVITAGHCFANKTTVRNLVRPRLLVGLAAVSLIWLVRSSLEPPSIGLDGSAAGPAAMLLPVPENHGNELRFFVKHPGGEPAECGACRVLLELRDALALQGYEADAGERCPADGPAGNVTTVVVYPEADGEVCRGYPGPMHVRWILAPLGVRGSADVAAVWGAGDLVFHYSPSAGVDVLDSNILQVVAAPPDVPAEVLEGKNRSGVAWTIRRGEKFHDHINHIHERPGLNATEFETGTPNSIAALGGYEYFVSYDPYTYWIFLAAMSGAVSVVYPIANISREEWASHTFVGPYLKSVGSTEIPGVAYGWEESEIGRARATMRRVRPMLAAVREWGADVTVPRLARDAWRFRHGERSRFEGAILKSTAY